MKRVKSLIIIFWHKSRIMKKEKHKEKAQKKKKKPLIAPKTEKEQKKEIKKKRNRRKIPLIQLDRGGNIISIFFKQLKNPTRTWMDILLEKMLVIKIDESEKKFALKAEKPLDIMGLVKTVFRHVNNSGNN